MNDETLIAAIGITVFSIARVTISPLLLWGISPYLTADGISYRRCLVIWLVIVLAALPFELLRHFVVNAAWLYYALLGSQELMSLGIFGLMSGVTSEIKSIVTFVICDGVPLFAVLFAALILAAL